MTFGASNGLSPNATQNFTLTVGTEPVFTSADSTTFDVGTDGTFPVTSTGYPAPTITEWGTLPAGVSFTGGVLSGTPTQSGTFQIGFDADNGVGSGTLQDFTLTVAGLTITTSSLSPVTEGTPYSQHLTATGGVLPLKWAKVGKLPQGLCSRRPVCSGDGQRPKVTPGNYPIKVKVTDSASRKHQTATASFILTINS